VLLPEPRGPVKAIAVPAASLVIFSTSVRAVRSTPMTGQLASMPSGTSVMRAACRTASANSSTLGNRA
jgi:hypothetical protein